MLQANVNYLGVLLAGIAAQPLGFLWYGPLFGRAWMALRGYSEQDVEGGPGVGYLLGFGLALLEFWVLAHMIDWVGADTIGDCVLVAGVVWLGFIAPVIAMANIFSPRTSLALFTIESGYYLTAILVAGLILGLFQAPPEAPPPPPIA